MVVIGNAPADNRTINLYKLKFIFIYLSIGLSFFLAHGQQIGNYVNNGSFEKLRSNCSPPLYSPVLSYWSAIDTNKNGFVTHNTICGNVPISGAGYQWPKTGNGYVRTSSYIQNGQRGYFRNQLKSNLVANKIYCVKYHINVINLSPYGIDAYGAYFGDNTLDTITNPYQPKTFLVPQVQNPPGSFITDTLNWVPLTGTFTATGSEKYLVIGNFNLNTSTVQIQPPYNYVWCDINLDDVSVIEANLPAYASRDTAIYLGDSLFIGRQLDYAIDPYCVWFKVPNMTTAIDTTSGFWIKPIVTSTYVVRQELDCSPVKWDTVVISIKVDVDDTGLDKRQWLSDYISLFPNPTSGNLNISFSGLVPADIRAFIITNNLGQIARQENMQLINNAADISTSGLDAGLYQIRFDSRFGTVTKKFVKTAD
jgi:hypothetical protein